MKPEYVAANGNNGFRTESEFSGSSGFAEAHHVADDGDTAERRGFDERGSAPAVARMNPYTFEGGVDVQF